MAEPQESVTAAAATGLPASLVVTLGTATGGVLKLEVADTNGGHRELTKAERLELEKKFRGGVEALLERAFEAGVAVLLDDDGAKGAKDDRDETEDEAGVRRILLEPLLEEAFAARTARREAIRKAIVRSLIEDFTSAQKREAEESSAERAA